MPHEKKPFVRWVGGKRGLMDQLRPMVPKDIRCYHEPFVGGGAMFFDLHPVHAVLSDANAELVSTYTAIRDEPEAVIDELRAMPINEETYYSVRRHVLDATTGIWRIAARMIYLNKCGFNGLYRVNKLGEFNVPWGRWKPDHLPTTCDQQNLRDCSRSLNHVQILCEDFARVYTRAQAEDFVYFDPPYVPVSKTANFTGYTTGGFGPGDLERLALVCWQLTHAGVQVMVSNADVPETRNSFSAFRIDSVGARRSVNCDATKRGNVSEIVVRNYDDNGRIV